MSVNWRKELEKAPQEDSGSTLSNTLKTGVGIPALLLVLACAFYGIVLMTDPARGSPPLMSSINIKRDVVLVPTEEPETIDESTRESEPSPQKRDAGKPTKKIAVVDESAGEEDAMKSPPKSSFPSVDVVKKAIEEDGIYVVPSLLTKKEIYALRKYILKEFARPQYPKGKEGDSTAQRYTTKTHILKYYNNVSVNSKTMVDMDMTGVRWLQKDPRIRQYVDAILGTNSIRATQFHLSMNFMFHRFHYDIPYRTYNPKDNNIKVFFFLQPHDNETSAAFSVVPKSHRNYVKVKHGSWTAPGQLDFKPAVGDAVFMDSRIIHVGQVIP
eukprot:PhF_6_TR26251/c0_g1_i2/m.37541